MPSSPTKTSPCSVGRIVPASILMYMSHFTLVTLYPRDCNNLAMDAEVTPFPTDDITPPITKINLLFINEVVSSKKQVVRLGTITLFQQSVKSPLQNRGRN